LTAAAGRRYTLVERSMKRHIPTFAPLVPVNTGISIAISF
jgi:hypothetical protein